MSTNEETKEEGTADADTSGGGATATASTTTGNGATTEPVSTGSAPQGRPKSGIILEDGRDLIEVHPDWVGKCSLPVKKMAHWWKAFHEGQDDTGPFACCNICGQRRSMTGGGTASLIKHLKTYHNTIYHTLDKLKQEDQLQEKDRRFKPSSRSGTKRKIHSMLDDHEEQIRVFILLPSDDSIQYATSVCEMLSSRFSINDVTFRSSYNNNISFFDTTNSISTTTGTSSKNLDAQSNSNMISDATLFVRFVADENDVASTSNNCFHDNTNDSPVPMITIPLPKGKKTAANFSTINNQTFVTDSCLVIAKFCSLVSTRLRKKVHDYILSKQQSYLIQDKQLQTKSPKYLKAISKCYDTKSQNTGSNVITENSDSNANGGLEKKYSGKVRDRYEKSASSKKNIAALVTTDRQSGFDRQLALVPYKGAVLNLTSAFWFEQTKHIISNHLISVPHPSVSIVRKCKPFPIEFVMRSYMTGSTSTSIWKNYQSGCRNYCGHVLPEGMKRNQKLKENLLTPTTKEEHDRPISCEDIINENLMSIDDLNVCKKAASSLFDYGQKLASKHGLILVDTKYEFGKDYETGKILLIDELHTPDSSRYWIASTYEQHIAEGKEPENIDKEFLRLWFREHCDPYKDGKIPEAPRDLVLELSRRYISLYEMITWKEFNFLKNYKEQDIEKVLQDQL